MPLKIFMIKRFIILSTAFISGFIFSFEVCAYDEFQSKSSPGANQCVLHLDKSFYVTGEIIWFKTTLPENLTYNASLVRIDLMKKDGASLVRFYRPIDQDLTAHGSIKIPFDFSPDIYIMAISLTREDNNELVVLVNHPLAIYNDLHTDLNMLDHIDDKQSFTRKYENPLTVDEQYIQISSPKTAYHPREKVTIQLKTNDAGINHKRISMAITDATLVNDDSYYLPNISVGPKINETFEVDNDIAFKGIVYDTANKPHEDDYLAVVLYQEGYLRIFESLDDGSFKIDVPYFEGERHMQLINLGNQLLSFELSSDISVPANLNSLQLVYTQEIVEYLKESEQRKKINQLFNQLEYSNYPEPKDEEHFFKPDRSFEISNFEFFPTMVEFFKQFSTPLKLKKRKNKENTIIRMVNPDDKPYYPGSPRFMVNGNFIDNSQFAVNLEMKDLERIDLFYLYRNLKQQFDVLGNQGVVAIYTHEEMISEVNKEVRNTFKIMGAMPSPTFDSITNQKISQSDKPLFRPVIYWNPAIEFDENGEANITFYHTDDLGQFNVEVVGNALVNLKYVVN